MSSINMIKEEEATTIKELSPPTEPTFSFTAPDEGTEDISTTSSLIVLES